jgi:60 kDa SS-A/Ro ribonucleoprotein
MARFNTKAVDKTKTKNLAGGDAYQLSPEMELASIATTSMVKDGYYRSANETIDRVRELIENPKMDPMFAAKTAVFTRHTHGLRSISHVIAVEAMRREMGEPSSDGATFIEAAVRRPDDMTEMLAYYGHTYGRPFPKQLRRGIGRAFGKFNRYQLAKYRGEGRDVSLVDAANICHPTPNGNAEALKDLINGNLKSTGDERTWESALTEAGQESPAADGMTVEGRKADVWRDLLTEGKLGYFALLRNLRNIAEQAPDLADLAVTQLTNPQAIRKSLVLPFRFLSASGALNQAFRDDKGDKDVLKKFGKAIGLALEHSLENIPEVGGSTLVALDTSGSMGWFKQLFQETHPHYANPVPDGKTDPIEIGALFAASLVKRWGADLMYFCDGAEYHDFSGMGRVIDIVKMVGATRVNGGTNFHAPFERATKAARKYDRIVVISDMQGWMQPANFDAYGRGTSSNLPAASFANYKAITNCNPDLFMVDLAGMGSIQFPAAGVYCVSGFSEKIFETIKMFSEDRDALVTQVNAVNMDNYRAFNAVKPDGDYITGVDVNRG